jgi:arginase
LRGRRQGEIVQISLIQVPYMAGDDRQGSSKGPRRFIEAGAPQLLFGKGLDVVQESIDRGRPFHDTGSASLAVGKQLASVVRRCIGARRFPFVLGGGCDVSAGVLSGFEHSRCGVIWFDAHGDFNTPESTISGYFPGMSLAIVAGDCFVNYWAQIGNSVPILKTSILMLGVRDLDPMERDRLETSGIRVVRWHNGKPAANVASALRELAKSVREVYVHIDMDALDPEVAPGVVVGPVPGGLSLNELKDAIHDIFEHFRVRAASLVAYNPDRDHDDKTVLAGLEIIETLGQHVGRM